MSDECVRLERVLAARKLRGYVRECHGDLHLENLAYWEGRIVPFDSLEFDPELRWIDVMDEAAFLVMDLFANDRRGLAHEFLNRYLEVTGDYSGLEVFRFYLIHRAIVRAKVAAIQGSKAPGSGSGVGRKVDRYLRCARETLQPATPLLLITHGFSGSGKTTVTDRLISQLPALRCRSDLERKRLHAVAPRAKSRSPVGGGLYTRSAGEATYAALRQYAALALGAGFDVIVDATFLRRAERESFIQLAAAKRSCVAIIDCRASERVLRERIESRLAANLDVSEATLDVLDYQLETEEPLGPDEVALTVGVDTSEEIFPEAIAREIAATVS
jgi:predicted kinase